MEDLHAIKEQKTDVIQDLAGAEREREKEANKLRRWSRQTILMINLSQLGEGYAAIKEIYNRFTSKRGDWIELLGTKSVVQSNILYSIVDESVATGGSTNDMAAPSCAINGT